MYLRILQSYFFITLTAFIGLSACEGAVFAAGLPKDINKGQNRLALIIGNSKYALLPPLQNPGNDAADMCSALSSYGFDVICKIDLRSKREIKDAIFDFSQRIDKNSTALFYFAGHAVEVEGGNFLLPTEALIRTKNDVADEAVELNYLMSELSVRKPMLSIVMLDACRNNPLPKLYQGPAAAGLNIGIVADIPNSILMFSTSSGSLALDGKGRNGIFTRSLLANINIPGLSIFDIQQRIIKEVEIDSKQAGVKQLPVVKYSYSGNFCFSGCIDVNERAKELTVKESQLIEQQKKLETLKGEIEAREKGLFTLQVKEQELHDQQSRLDALRRELDSKLSDIQSKEQSNANREKDLQKLDQLKRDIEQRERALVTLKSKEQELSLQQRKLDQLNDELKEKELQIKNEQQRIERETRTSGPDEKPRKDSTIIVPTF